MSTRHSKRRREEYLWQKERTQRMTIIAGNKPSHSARPERWACNWWVTSRIGRNAPSIYRKARMAYGEQRCNCSRVCIITVSSWMASGMMILNVYSARQIHLAARTWCGRWPERRCAARAQRKNEKTSTVLKETTCMRGVVFDVGWQTLLLM